MPRLCSAALHSNISCAAEKKAADKPATNTTPLREASWRSISRAPSTPTANPTRLAAIIRAMLAAAAMAFAFRYADGVKEERSRGASSVLISSSGAMKAEMRKAQARRFGFMSCHRATNAKIGHTLHRAQRLPPKGTYMYLHAKKCTRKPRDPLVEGVVPLAPEAENRVVVAHATEHILGSRDAVKKSE